MNPLLRHWLRDLEASVTEHHWDARSPKHRPENRERRVPSGAPFTDWMLPTIVVTPPPAKEEK